MLISEHTNKLRKYLEFRNYSKMSIKNYCSNFNLFLAHFEKLGITHPVQTPLSQICTQKAA